METVLLGTLSYWIDEQTNELVYLFIEDNPESLDKVHQLNDGDHLVVMNKDDSIVFQGLIDKKYQEILILSGNQTIAISWIQRHKSQSSWIELFIHELSSQSVPFRAELKKRIIH